MVLGLRFPAPAGDIELAAVPASAAGPELRQLLVGSEGTLGVISELALRVRPAPRERAYEGVFFEDFAAGVQALRALAQEHAAPDVARLSDEAETRMSLALAGSGGLKGRLGKAYLGLRGYRGGCSGDPRLRGGGRGGGRSAQARARAGTPRRWPSGGALAGGGVARSRGSPRRICATSC